MKQTRGRFGIPIVAIGGTTPSNRGSLVEAGADILAVISRIYDNSSPAENVNN